MSTFASVVIGVVSSLLATFLFIGLTHLTRRVIIPWAEDKIYRGLRIDGRWIDLNIPPDSKVSMLLELTQKADRISGFYSHEDDGPESKATYRVQGEIRNTYVNASLWPLSDKLLDSGTLLARVYHKDGSLQMGGALAYVSSEDGTVISSAVIFKHDS